jgi:transposase
MSTEADRRGDTGQTAGLFEASELPTPEACSEAGQAPSAGRARVMSAQRDQVELRACDLDSVLGAEHPVRAVWAFVGSLDLAPLHARIRSVEGGAGRPAIDPAILVALWLWATIDGVGSARELDRLCERDDAYRWICGGVGVNYHTLADFRVRHGQWLDAQLTRSIASLLERRLVTLSVVAQDGLRVRAPVKASSMRRRERLEQFLVQARAQVAALKAELEADAGASARRKQAARERAAREREQRLERALETMKRIEAREPRGKKQARQAGDDDEPGPPAPDVPPQAQAVPPQAVASKLQAEPRVSTTDAEARVMKMPDGGFRPAYNAQLAVDTATQLIAGVALVDVGTDMRQAVPMHDQIQARYAHTPEQWLADGGFTRLEAIEELTRRGTQPFMPVPRSRNPDIDPFAPKPTDSQALIQWRARMASDAGKERYKLRAASVECVNAQVRRRGLTQLRVCGLLKARSVLLWHALAHNLMRMRSLGIAYQA